MSFEYEFEDIEVTYNGHTYTCDGTCIYDLEDTAVGMVPYGDTHVYHPGDGIVVEMESVCLGTVLDENGEEVGHLPRPDVGEKLPVASRMAGDALWPTNSGAQAAFEEMLGGILVDDHSDTLIDDANKRFENDEIDRADSARKDRDER